MSFFGKCRFVALALAGLSSAALPWSSIAAEAVTGDPLAKMERLSAGALPMPLRILGPGPLPGLQEVLLADGAVVFMSDDGSVVIVGTAVNFEKKEASGGKASLRPKTFEELSSLGGIRFGGGNVDVIVFSDPDCPHCKKLHSELESLVAAGKTVQIMPFSATSADAKKMESVLCAKDRGAAWGMAMTGADGQVSCREGELEARTISAVGRAMKITATPTIVYKSGAIVPGYAKATAIGERIVSPQMAPPTKPE